MTDPAAEMPARRHSLVDWLALHELDPTTCRRLLDNLAEKSPGGSAVREKTTPGYQRIDLETAWLRIVEALRDFLPEQHGIIDDAFDNTTKIDVGPRNKSRKALTLDNGPASYPTILFSYRGEPSDCLIMAHEFGHALQIVASRGKFMPPVVREVCAFLAESALLSNAVKRDPAHYAHLAEAWRQDTHRYFGLQRDRLAAALSEPAAPYKYSWNYPIARYLAIEVAERFSRDRIWSVFSGETSVRGVLQELGSPSG